VWCSTIPIVRRKIVVLLGAITVSVSACASTRANSLQGKDPDSILSQSLRTAVKFAGVHYVLRTTNGGQSQMVTGDAGTTIGAQSTVVGSDETVVEMVGTTAFLRGNAGGLQNIIGWASGPASRYAGTWISLRPTDSLYQTVVQGVTLSTLLAQLSPVSPLIESSPGTVAGQQVVGVRGDLRSSPGQGEATFWVATSPPNVPVGIDAQATGKNTTVTEVGVFTKWGERFRLRAPSGAVPFSSLATP